MNNEAPLIPGNKYLHSAGTAHGRGTKRDRDPDAADAAEEPKKPCIEPAVALAAAPAAAVALAAAGDNAAAPAAAPAPVSQRPTLVVPSSDGSSSLPTPVPALPRPNV